jgi:tetratricopeptide (TPR) repeat protein
VSWLATVKKVCTTTNARVLKMFYLTPLARRLFSNHTSFSSIYYCRLGNKAFAERDYQTAIAHYTKAIQLEPNNHIFFSNRRSVMVDVVVTVLNLPVDVQRWILLMQCVLFGHDFTHPI